MGTVVFRTTREKTGKGQSDKSLTIFTNSRNFNTILAHIVTFKPSIAISPQTIFHTSPSSKAPLLAILRAQVPPRLPDASGPLASGRGLPEGVPVLLVLLPALGAPHRSPKPSISACEAPLRGGMLSRMPMPWRKAGLATIGRAATVGTVTPKVS